MSESGGPTTQSGIFFQNTVAAWYLAKMLQDHVRGVDGNRIISVRCEAPDEVDDIVVTYERGRSYVQVKESLASSEAAWKQMWRQFWKQFGELYSANDRLILWAGLHNDLFRNLDAMARRSQNVASGSGYHQFSEWLQRLTQEQQMLLNKITMSITLELKADSAVDLTNVGKREVFELLQKVEVVVKGNAIEIAEQAIAQFLADTDNPSTVFAVLRDLAAEKARVRGEYTYESLKSALESRQLLIGVESKHLVVDERRASLKQELEIHERSLGMLRIQAAIYKTLSRLV